MYEENTKPLPAGDATSMFAKELRGLAQMGSVQLPLTPDRVVQLAKKSMQPHFAEICRKLLLPGSSIKGWRNVEELGQRARAGKACLLCLSHVSNLDVPILYAILEDQHDIEVFNQIIWIAGRKLSEDTLLTQTLIQSCNRIVVTPLSWFSGHHSEKEQRQAHTINRAAQREMVKLRHEGWIFGLFPTGTRIRPGVESTARAIAEVDTYLKTFDFIVIGRIDGCTLPVSREQDFMHETPKRDRVIFTFGSVHRTNQWRADALKRFPDLGQRLATAHAIDEAMTGFMET